MRFADVHTPEQALVYLTDCTLATVSDMAMKKTRPKGEFQRQIRIAQKACDWLESMNIDPGTTRAKDIVGITTVAAWAETYMQKW